MNTEYYCEHIIPRYTIYPTIKGDDKRLIYVCIIYIYKTKAYIVCFMYRVINMRATA